MLQTLINAFKVKEIRRKIFMMLLLLLVFRLGCFIPVPGLDGATFSTAVEGNDFLTLMSSITGGALSQGTLFALGIGPYINASIILQLLCVGIPALERLSKQGEEGRKKIAQITRYVTIGLAIIQSVGIIINFANQGDGALDANVLAIFGNQKWLLGTFMAILYTAGAFVVMWIGERITDYGVSNGISLLIFAGILSTAGTTILGMFTSWTDASLWILLGFVLTAIVIFGAIVTVESAERKIPVQYAKQVKGRKMYGGQSTHIPIKVNSSGVMPLIFAFSILSFPDLIINLVGGSTESTWWGRNVGTGTWVYMVLLCLLILFFAYFYNQIQFNPDDVSKSIQGNGGFIPGTRPGKPTADYLRRISNRITLFGAIFLAVLALVPSAIFKAIGGTGLMNVFSATGLLIIVSVALEFEQALQSQIMMKNYKGFLK